MVLAVSPELIFSANPLPQALLDAAWRVTRANPAWVAVFGDGATTAWIDLQHPDDLARDLLLIASVQSGTRSSFRAQSRLRNLAGGWTTMTVVVSAFIRDSSAVSDTAHTDVIMVTVLPEPAVVPGANTAASQDSRLLAGALSHDVRQHARLISSYGSLLERSDLDERQRSQMAVITDHADRLQGVLTLLVRWLRLADHTVIRQPCDVAALWDVATADLPADFHHGALPIITGEPELISSLLRELALNAVRYHAGRATITLDAIPADHGWLLTVTDDGPGIPEPDHERMLLPLQRRHRWDEVPGHGMGLALATRIAVIHGGDLRLGVAPAGGCTVQVRLPG